MHRQQGITLGGFLVVAVILAFGALLAFKVIPHYMEFWAIKKTMTATVRDPTLQEASVAEIRSAFDRRADIDNITAVKGRDIVVSKEGGALVLSTSYQVKVPLFANVSLLIDFSYTTR